jgi:hypothetical protein
VAARRPWRHRRWVPIVGAIAAALVLLGVGWTTGYTMGGGDGGNRHSQYDNGPFGNRRGFDGQRVFPGPQFGPKQNRPFGPPGQQKNQPTPQPTPSKSG